MILFAQDLLDCGDADVDTMVGLPGDQTLWRECKEALVIGVRPRLTTLI
jgi:hypothetical protein